MIKLVNLLKENEEESGITGVKSQYDITLGSKSNNLSGILDALSDTGNYGMYLSNLINTDPRVKELVAKEFSPSGGPNMKVAKATDMWNKGTPKFRNEKQQILKDRLRNKGIKFDDEDWSALSFKSLPKEARNMNNFFIEKSKPAMDEFIKSIAKSIGILNYEEKDGELVFPSKSNPKKDVTKKIIKTVMDNAGISDYQIAQREVGTSDEDGKKVKTKKSTTPISNKVESSALITLFKDEVLAKKFKSTFLKKGEYKFKPEDITIEQTPEGKWSFNIKGLTDNEKINKIKSLATMFKTTGQLNEVNDFTRMQKLAGLRENQDDPTIDFQKMVKEMDDKLEELGIDGESFTYVEDEGDLRIDAELYYGYWDKYSEPSDMYPDMGPRQGNTKAILTVIKDITKKYKYRITNKENDRGELTSTFTIEK